MDLNLKLFFSFIFRRKRILLLAITLYLVCVPFLTVSSGLEVIGGGARTEEYRNFLREIERERRNVPEAQQAAERQALLEMSTISSSRANAMFRKFASRGSIPFRYPIDGCYARATEMNRIAEREGIIMGNVFTTGRLQVATDNPRYPLVQWGYHVAPVVKVRQNDGREVIMVFDPSLFDRPVTISEWNNRMLTRLPSNPQAIEPRIDRTFLSRRFQDVPRSSEANSWSEETLNRRTETFSRYRPLDDNRSIPRPRVNIQGARQ